MTGRRRPLGAAAVVLALGLLTGCSDDPAPPPAPSPAQTSTPTLSATTATPTATLPPAPLLPAAAARADQQGAEAFFRYFWDVYSWSFLAGDFETLKALGTKDCAFCASSVEALQDVRARRLTTTGGQVRTTDVAASFGDPRSGLPIVGLIDQEPSEQRDPAGRVVWSGRALVQGQVTARVIWLDGDWHMDGVAVNAGGTP